MRSTRDPKVELERWAFDEFARHARLPIRPGSVESRRPPEPDILCEVEGDGPVAYELVELIDPLLAENASVAVRKGVPAEATWVGDPTRERIEAKLLKSYRAACPVELVAWASPFITPPDVWQATHAEALRALAASSQFRRIWVVNLGGPADERGVWFVDPPRPT